MERRPFERRSFAPVRVGDEVDVKIEAVGEKGDGIAKVKGFVIFVPNTHEGDQVKIRITKVLRKVGFGEVVGEATESPAEEGGETEGGESAEKGSGEVEEGSDDEEETVQDSEDFGEDEKD